MVERHRRRVESLAAVSETTGEPFDSNSAVLCSVRLPQLEPIELVHLFEEEQLIINGSQVRPGTCFQCQR